MKVFLILILSFTFIISARAQDYPDSGFTNKAEAKNLMVNGLKEGKWVEYIDDTLQVTANESKASFYRLSIYKSGKIYGIINQYYKNGKIECTTPYTDGKRNGLEKVYYKTGELEWEIPFTKDKENGISKKYYTNGRLEFEFPYTNSKLNGFEKIYYKNGNLQSETEWLYSHKTDNTKNYDKNSNEIK